MKNQVIADGELSIRLLVDGPNPASRRIAGIYGSPGNILGYWKLSKLRPGLGAGSREL